jgi:hypothetical protein
MSRCGLEAERAGAAEMRSVKRKGRCAGFQLFT